MNREDDPGGVVKPVAIHTANRGAAQTPWPGVSLSAQLSSLAVVLLAVCCAGAFLCHRIERASVNAEGTGQEPAAPWGSDGLRFTHRFPPVVADDVPDLKVALSVVNQTAETVRFDKVRPSCSCSGAGLRTTSLAPGEQTTLDVEVNLRGRAGEQRLPVYLEDSAGRCWSYTAEVAVYERARFSAPGNSLQFGSADPNARVSRETVLELCACSKESLPALEKITVTSPTFTAQTGEPRDEQVADGIWVRRVPVAVLYTVPSQPGPYQEQLTARYVFCGQSKDLHLGLSGYTNSLFEVSPVCIFFNQAEAKRSTKSQRVHVRRTDGGPLHVRGVETSAPCVKATLEPTTNPATAVLLLTLDLAEVRGSLWGEVVLSTDHPKQPSLKIPFAATPDKPH